MRVNVNKKAALQRNMEALSIFLIPILTLILISEISVAKTTPPDTRPSKINSADSPIKLPLKILSGYFNFWLDRSSVEDTILFYLKPMKDAKFNCCEIKIQPTNVDLSDKTQLEQLRKLSKAIQDHNMVFMVYVYPHPHNGRRIYNDLPAFVDSNGKEHPDQYSLAHWKVWRRVFDNAFQLAKVSKELKIAAIKLDIETIQSEEISYDDESWQKFIDENKLHNLLDKKTPAYMRYPQLKSLGLLPEYEEWFESQADIIAKRFEEEMHKINPALILGFMPAGSGRYALAFTKYLATARTAAIIDSWCMYNGEGFTREVLKEQERVKALNKNNLFIPWFRINNYRAEDITIQAYYAAMNTDGYSNWTMSMLNPRWENNSRPSVYKLPPNYTPEQYYKAYKKANEFILKDVSAGNSRPTIPYRPVRPLPAPLDLTQVKFLNIEPCGSGEGRAQWLTLREQQSIYIYAEKGEEIAAEIRHLAGKKRMITLNLAILNSKGDIILQDEVLAGEHKRIITAAPQRGGYILVITGGSDGQAWYAVKVHNRHMGLLADPQSYFFYTHPFEIWVRRADINEPASITIWTKRKEIVAVNVDDSDSIIIKGDEKRQFMFPEGKDLIKIRISRPSKIPKGSYVQDIFISVKSSLPFIFDHPQRCIRCKIHDAKKNQK